MAKSSKKNSKLKVASKNNKSAARGEKKHASKSPGAKASKEEARGRGQEKAKNKQGKISETFFARDKRSFRPSLTQGRKNVLGRGLAALMNPLEVRVEDGAEQLNRAAGMARDDQTLENSSATNVLPKLEKQLAQKEQTHEQTRALRILPEASFSSAQEEGNEERLAESTESSSGWQNEQRDQQKIEQAEKIERRSPRELELEQELKELSARVLAGRPFLDTRQIRETSKATPTSSYRQDYSATSFDQSMPGLSAVNYANNTALKMLDSQNAQVQEEAGDNTQDQEISRDKGELVEFAESLKTEATPAQLFQAANHLSQEQLVEKEAESAEQTQTELLHLPAELLVRNEKQPRQSFPIEEIQNLAESIKETGLLQPIIARRLARPDEHGALYEIVAGERRFRAAKLAGLKKIPVLLRELDDKETLELGIIENVQRADLNPIEEAQAYRRLIEDYGSSQEEVAKVVAKDRTSIANALRLLKLPPVVRSYLAEKKLSAGHGRALLMLERPQEQIVLAHRIMEEGLSVRAVERIIAENRAETPAGKQPAIVLQIEKSGKTARVLELEERIRRALGTKVDLKLSRSGSGELRISFFSNEEFESLLEHLGA